MGLVHLQQNCAERPYSIEERFLFLAFGGGQFEAGSGLSTAGTVVSTRGFQSPPAGSASFAVRRGETSWSWGFLVLVVMVSTYCSGGPGLSAGCMGLKVPAVGFFPLT